MCGCSEQDRHDYGPCGEDCGVISDGELRALFGVKDMPDVPRFRPVKDDYTAGFANGVEAVLEWLRALPKIEMPTDQKDVVTVHDMSAIEAAIHLEQKIENVKNA